MACSSAAADEAQYAGPTWFAAHGDSAATRLCPLALCVAARSAPTSFALDAADVGVDTVTCKNASAVPFRSCGAKSRAPNTCSRTT